MSDAATRHRAIRDFAIHYGSFDSTAPRLWRESATTADEIFGLTLGDGDEHRRLALELDPQQEPQRGPWALMVIRDIDRRQTDLAGRRFEGDGALIVDVHVYVTDPGADRIAASIAAEFACVYGIGSILSDAGRIIMNGPTIRQLGPEGKWYRVRVDAPFRWYEVTR